MEFAADGRESRRTESDGDDGSHLVPLLSTSIVYHTGGGLSTPFKKNFFKKTIDNLTKACYTMDGGGEESSLRSGLSCGLAYMPALKGWPIYWPNNWPIYTGLINWPNNWPFVYGLLKS